MERSAVSKLVPDFIWIDLGRQVGPGTQSQVVPHHRPPPVYHITPVPRARWYRTTTCLSFHPGTQSQVVPHHHLFIISPRYPEPGGTAQPPVYYFTPVPRARWCRTTTCLSFHPGTQSHVVPHHHLFIISPWYPEPGGTAPPPVYHFTPVPRARWCRTTTCLSFYPGTQSQVVPHHHRFIFLPRYPEPGGTAPPPVYHFTPVPRARWCRTTTCLSFHPGTKSHVVPHNHLFIISSRYPEPGGAAPPPVYHFTPVPRARWYRTTTCLSFHPGTQSQVVPHHHLFIISPRYPEPGGTAPPPVYHFTPVPRARGYRTTTCLSFHPGTQSHVVPHHHLFIISPRFPEPCGAAPPPVYHFTPVPRARWYCTTTCLSFHPVTQSQVVPHHHLFIISPRYPEPGGTAPPPVYYFTPVPRARWYRTTTCLSFHPGTQSQQSICMLSSCGPPGPAYLVF